MRMAYSTRQMQQCMPSERQSRLHRLHLASSSNSSSQDTEGCCASPATTDPYVQLSIARTPTCTCSMWYGKHSLNSRQKSCALSIKSIGCSAYGVLLHACCAVQAPPHQKTSKQGSATTPCSSTLATKLQAAQKRMLLWHLLPQHQLPADIRQLSNQAVAPHFHYSNTPSRELAWACGSQTRLLRIEQKTTPANLASCQACIKR